jgi:hypothetical protein
VSLSNGLSNGRWAFSDSLNGSSNLFLDLFLQVKEAFQFHPLFFLKGSNLFSVYALCYFLAEIIDTDHVTSQKKATLRSQKETA